MLQREKQDILARMVRAMNAQQAEIKKFVEEYDVDWVDLQDLLSYKEADSSSWESSTDWFSSALDC